MKQHAMFVDGTDLPIFSGTAQHDASASYQPITAPELEQVGLPVTCRACLDTGILLTRSGKYLAQKPCWCRQ